MGVSNAGEVSLGVEDLCFGGMRWKISMWGEGFVFGYIQRGWWCLELRCDDDMVRPDGLG